MLEQIRSFLKNTPFRPFEIHCSSGEVFRVEHPENAAVVGGYAVVALPDGKNTIMISALHITGVSGIRSVTA
jgi:hypothetical protein